MNDPRLYKIRLILDSVKYSGVGFFNRDGILCIGGEHIEGVPFGDPAHQYNDYFKEREYIRTLLRKQFYVHYPELKDRVWQD